MSKLPYRLGGERNAFGILLLPPCCAPSLQRVHQLGASPAKAKGKRLRVTAPMMIRLAAIEIGRELGLDIVAEGIETEAQRDALRIMNCPFGPGYLFGAPLEPDAFKALVGVSG